MTEKDQALARKWMERYEGFYHTLPDSFSQRLNPRIAELDTERRRIQVRYRTTAWMLNPMGTVHGGILASMADTSAGMLSKALINAWNGSPTVSMTVQYLRPVMPDRDVAVQAECHKSGRFLNYTSCRAFYPERPEETLFTGECVYFSALEAPVPLG